MEFISFLTNFRTRPEWLKANQAQRGTWLSLQFYCASAENGGVITNSKQWENIIWLQAATVAKADVDSACDLFWWDGDDLHILAYNTAQEDIVKSGRATYSERGKKGGQATSQAKIEAARKNGAKHNPSEPKQNPSRTQAEPKQNPSEGKGSEEKCSEVQGGEQAHTEDMDSPCSLSAALEYAKTQSGQNVQGVVFTDDMVSKWFLHRSSADWKRGADEIPIRNWKADLMRWGLDDKLRSSQLALAPSFEFQKNKNGGRGRYMTDEAPELRRVKSYLQPTHFAEAFEAIYGGDLPEWGSLSEDIQQAITAWSPQSQAA